MSDWTTRLSDLGDELRELIDTAKHLKSEVDKATRYARSKRWADYDAAVSVDPQDMTRAIRDAKRLRKKADGAFNSYLDKVRLTILEMETNRKQMQISDKQYQSEYLDW